MENVITNVSGKNIAGSTLLMSSTVHKMHQHVNQWYAPCCTAFVKKTSSLRCLSQRVQWGSVEPLKVQGSGGMSMAVPLAFERFGILTVQNEPHCMARGQTRWTMFLTKAVHYSTMQRPVLISSITRCLLSFCVFSIWCMVALAAYVLYYPTQHISLFLK